MPVVTSAGRLREWSQGELRLYQHSDSAKINTILQRFLIDLVKHQKFRGSVRARHTSQTKIAVANSKFSSSIKIHYFVNIPWSMRNHEPPCETNDDPQQVTQQKNSITIYTEESTNEML